MRIVMAADTYKPYVSGVTVYIDLLKQEMERMGHDVTVLAFGSGPPPEPGVILSPGITHPPTGFQLGARLSREAREAIKAADAVHVHHPFLSGRLALSVARKEGVPAVFTAHTRYDLYTDIYTPKPLRPSANALLLPYLRRFCEQVDLVVAPSAGIKEALRESGIEAPIDVVNNPVDVEPFRRELDPAGRQAFGFSQDQTVLAYVGRLSPEKRLEMLIDAFGRARRDQPSLVLLLVGDGQSRAELESHVEEAGLAETVMFAGMVPREELPDVLAGCDAFVSASVSETFPITYLEAMAVGLPTIGVVSPGVSDMIEDGTTGRLCPDDTAALAQAMGEMAEDPDKRKRMGQAARGAVRRYDVSHTANALLDTYRRLAALGPDSAPGTAETA